MRKFCFIRAHARLPVFALVAVACGALTPGGAGLPSTARAENRSTQSPADPGRQIFHDTALSASGKLACSTCHNPANAHARSNNLPVQYGGANLEVPGLRATYADGFRVVFGKNVFDDPEPALLAAGVVGKFNHVPALLRRNVNVSEVPYDWHPGQTPRLNDAEIEDLAASLGTLTDGYDPLTNCADPARIVPTSTTN